MRKTLVALAAAVSATALALQVESAEAAPVHDLVLLQVGDGTDAGGTLGTGTAAVVLRDYDITFGVGNIPTATLMQSIPVPTTPAVSGNRALTLQDTASAEGGLNISSNGQYFVFGGYNSAVDGTASTGTTDRVIGRLDLAGNVDTTTAIPATVANWGSTTGSAPRSVASTDGANFWIGTSANGVRYIPYGSNTTTQINTTNGRRVDIFDDVNPVSTNDQLYISAQTTTIPLQGIGEIGSGTPTSGTNSTVPLAGMPQGANSLGSSYDFWFANSTTLYVADDRTTGGGVQKWAFDGTNWVLQFTMGTGPHRGLTGVVIGTDVILFSTTAHVTAGGNLLLAFNDTLGNTLVGSVVTTTLDTAAANRQFRGLDYVVPEPSALALAGLGGLLALRRPRRG